MLKSDFKSPIQQTMPHSYRLDVVVVVVPPEDEVDVRARLLCQHLVVRHAHVRQRDDEVRPVLPQLARQSPPAVHEIFVDHLGK